MIHSLVIPNIERKVRVGGLIEGWMDASEDLI
jgi:hypothetical protein